MPPSPSPLSIPTYKDLLPIKVNDIGEPFVTMDGSPVKSEYDERFSEDARLFSGSMIVRRTVRTLLERAQEDLQRKSPDLRLHLTYGYRTLDVQKKAFEEKRRSMRRWYPLLPQQELYERVHTQIAVPAVAGHPTGGAVDVTLTDAESRRLDMGSDLYDFDGCIETFDPRVDDECRARRLLLRSCMTNVGFAPFDGEWWHFSYGDKEWAFLMWQKCALYAQKTLEEAKALLLS